MKLWVGVTDNDWFKFLAGRRPEEVNFWQPGGGSHFRAIERGVPFLFKRCHPLYYVVGAGSFVGHSLLRPPIAWDSFERWCRASRSAGRSPTGRPPWQFCTWA